VQDALDMNPVRLFYLAFGWLCVGLGVIGIILPILPTTPFLLLAVWAFSKSSPALAARLRNNARFGPLIRAWQDHGAIPVFGKVMAVAMMAASAVYVAGFSAAPAWVAILVVITVCAVGGYVVTRPSRPPA
jgi:uncharacterized membrane protein YbaN (DUF454 family)